METERKPAGDTLGCPTWRNLGLSHKYLPDPRSLESISQVLAHSVLLRT